MTCRNLKYIFQWIPLNNPGFLQNGYLIIYEHIGDTDNPTIVE